MAKGKDTIYEHVSIVLNAVFFLSIPFMAVFGDLYSRFSYFWTAIPVVTLGLSYMARKTDQKTGTVLIIFSVIGIMTALIFASILVW